MWEDIQAKRKTEIEFINGAVAKLGMSKGVATPLNIKITECIIRLEKGEVVSLEEIQK